MSNTTSELFTPPSSLFARLLACENLDVTCNSNARTASFNPTSRVLTLPSWRGFSNDAWQLFIAHEVGHALFTPAYAEHAVDGASGLYLRGLAAELRVSRGQLHLVLNILEDIRIERKIREKYRGLAGFFSRGYLELLNRGFFGFKSIAAGQANWSGKGSTKYKTLDRLNIYAKVGSLCSLTLSKPNDIRWYNAALAANTFEDIVELAKDIVRTINAQNEAKRQKERKEKKEQKETSKPDAAKTPEPAEDPNEHDEESESSNTNESEASDTDSGSAPDIEADEDDQDGDEGSTEPVPDAEDAGDDVLPEDNSGGTSDECSEGSEGSDENSDEDNDKDADAPGMTDSTSPSDEDESDSLESGTSRAARDLLEVAARYRSDEAAVRTMSRDLGFMSSGDIKVSRVLDGWNI